MKKVAGLMIALGMILNYNSSLVHGMIIKDVPEKQENGNESQENVSTNDLTNLRESLDSLINAKDSNGDTMLHRAVRDNSKKQIKMLIYCGADINAKNNLGKTPLHYAALYSSVDILGLLISKGADINAKDNLGKTPLHNAVTDRLGIVSPLINIALLIREGADVNAKDNSGLTPLHWAVLSLWNSKDVGEILIREGADVNAKDDSGKTPLHYAVTVLRQSDLFGLLISKGADDNIADNNGETPLQILIKNTPFFNVELPQFVMTEPKAPIAEDIKN